jgi:hypothetical protein
VKVYASMSLKHWDLDQYEIGDQIIEEWSNGMISVSGTEDMGPIPVSSSKPMVDPINKGITLYLSPTL